MNVLDTENWQWFNEDQNGDIPFEGRQGHSMNAVKHCLVLFGGERKFNKNLKMRECYSDCRIFNTLTNQWILIRLHGNHLESRRNHLSCMVGKFLVIIGGIDSNGKHLNDVCAINLETHKVQSLDQSDGYNQGIAFAGCCSVLKNENKIENMYIQWDKQVQNNQGLTNISGIYVFGGRMGNGDTTNKLRILQIGKKPLKWIDPFISGIHPEPRFSHTLSYYKKFNSLILVGGRNESYYSKEMSNIFSDLFIFSLDFF